jgi:hypothetical protein
MIIIRILQNTWVVSLRYKHSKWPISVSLCPYKISHKTYMQSICILPSTFVHVITYISTLTIAFTSKIYCLQLAVLTSLCNACMRQLLVLTMFWYVLLIYHDKFLTFRIEQWDHPYRWQFDDDDDEIVHQLIVGYGDDGLLFYLEFLQWFSLSIQQAIGRLYDAQTRVSNGRSSCSIFFLLFIRQVNNSWHLFPKICFNRLKKAK